MQEKLEDDCAVALEMLFKLIDVFKSTLPERTSTLGWEFLPVEKFRMDPHYQYLFIVRAVEYADSSSRRQRLRVPPQEIVLHFLLRRLLEAEHLATLRIDSAHDMFDQAVFSGGVHAL